MARAETGSMASNSEPTGGTNTAASVRSWLRERIRRGRLVPGQRLVEADIVAETGASRARVREALQRLEAEGLVVIEEFRGASVRRLSPSEVRQIYRARLALEGIAAHDFALVDDPVRKAELVRLQDEMNTLEHTGNHRRFAALNDDWHDLILDGAGNDYIRTFVDRLRLPLYRLLFSAFYQPSRIDDANRGHRLVTAAIVAGDAALAETEMRQHIADALDAVGRLEDDLPA
ncbi:DNA-binding transcriptional regulator, GntR family [Sphingomonas guangdongensis]|uniref:DNA-binding transcriptional regulator, GntR family n=1 Tax=Sphingomonas guangdongensis TaxID=1141890 RepID=A0A285R301_9SPHN|nr:GntR family transcriptional regulator [Sphingomonas guangdongensis]SOB88254.1 DNA-binding transcriptional regulator, GntR family [Sphingomonas guangdongensis]